MVRLAQTHPTLFGRLFILSDVKVDSSDSSWGVALSLGDKGTNYPILAYFFQDSNRTKNLLV